MKLHYQTYFDLAAPEYAEQHQNSSPVLIIPGLFGSTANWRGFAKQLATRRRVIVVDQRNHGESPHAAENSYFDLVDDIVNLLSDLDIDKVTLCGHSMGGKTAMVFALTQAEKLDRLIVLDIAPVTYDHSHAPILEALQSLDLSLYSSRSAVEGALAQSIPDKSTRLFIMLSLTGKAGQFRWRLNVDALYANLPLISGFPTLELADHSYEDRCLFVKGGRSDYVNEDYYERIKKLFPAAVIKTVKQAGHWLHVEKPMPVLEQILTFLEKE